MEDCREIWCDGKWLRTDTLTVTNEGFGIIVGTGPQCCNGETFRPPIKGYILYCKGLVGWLVGWAFWAIGRLHILALYCKDHALVLLLAVASFCNQ